MMPLPVIIYPDQRHLRFLIYRLRYDVLVAERQRNLDHANHVSKTLEEPLDRQALLFASLKDGTVVGTCRVNYLRDLQDPFFFNVYQLNYFEQNKLADGVVVISRLVLHPSYRGTTSFKRMVTSIFEVLVKKNVSTIIMDTTPPMESMYRKLGFLPLGRPYIHKDGMEVLPMILDVNNTHWLFQIKSVLWACYPENFCINEYISGKVSALMKTSFP